MKKILFIITYLELGGAQKQLLYLLKGLDKDKYSLFLCSGDAGYLKSKFLEIPNVKIRLIPSLVRQINPILDLVTFFKLFLFIRKHKFDIVHTHCPKASILGRWAAFFAGTKNIVCTIHGWSFSKYMGIISYYFFLTLEKITAKITKKMIFVSRADLDIALKNKILDSKKLYLIRCGVEIDKFDRVFQERCSTAIDKRLIINISSFKPQKGAFYFLKMADNLLKKSYNLKFLIAGDGPYRREVLKQLNSLNLKDKVILGGWVEDISSLLAKCSIFVLPSLWEGLPLSVIEAVISGVPLVATDTGGLKDIVKNYSQGIIVEPREIEELSKAVIAILDNYDEWQDKIRRNRQEIDLSYWSKDRMVKETEDVYQAL